MIRERHLNFTLLTVRFYNLIYSLEQGKIFSELDVTDMTHINIVISCWMQIKILFFYI